jgi:hypothetical protein
VTLKQHTTECNQQAPFQSHIVNESSQGREQQERLTVSSPSSALLLPMVSVVEHMSGVTFLPPSRQLLRTLRQSSTG